MAAPKTLPGILMLGTVRYEKPEFDKLSDVATIQHVDSGTRQDFIRECRAGTYDNVVAVSRTYHSVAFTGPWDAELISHLPSSVKFLSHNGAGYDQIDVDACTAKGISVSNTPGAVDAATANTAMFLLLGALRRAWVPQLAVREGRWRGDSELGRDPDGLTLGILGMGGIGTALAKRAAAFGFRIQYHNRHPVAGLDEQFAHQSAPTYVGFDELLRTSDAISVHLPLGPATKGLIGARELDAMKENVIIVNTARGPIIDEAALVAALKSGKVWSVGLDVYEKEPEIHPGLLEHPGTMLLPHIGTSTIDTQRRMELLVIDNVRSAVSRGRLLTQVPEQKPLAAKV